MEVSIKVAVENDTNLPDDVARKLALVGHVMAIVQALKAEGLSVDEASERAGNAVRSAWGE